VHCSVVSQVTTVWPMAQIEKGRAEPVAFSILSDPWPPFLDMLDPAPDKAWEELYVFTWRLVQLRAPVIFRCLSEEDQVDLFEELLFDLQRDDFKKLRRYENEGKPFASWFWKVLYNRTLDFMKYTQRRQHEDASDLSEVLENMGASPEVQAEMAELLRQVEAALQHLSPQCQLLLLAAAEGYKPEELRILLGLGAGENKRLSDQLRHCRKKLTDELGQSGFTVEFGP
jgi:RNA polymerase sigma factor (sigma-70 family)